MIEIEVKQIPYCEKCRMFKPELKYTVYFAGDGAFPDWWIECKNREQCEVLRKNFENQIREPQENKDIHCDSESENSDIEPDKNEPPENYIPLKESYIPPVRESNRKAIVMATVITMAVSVIAMIAFYVVIALTN